MPHQDFDAAAPLQAFCHLLGEVHRTMLPAGASKGDGQVGLILDPAGVIETQSTELAEEPVPV